MAFTKGELLRHAIAFALRRVRLSGRRLGLTEEERLRVADDTLRELRRHGEWRELDDAIDGGPTAASSARPELDKRDRRRSQRLCLPSKINPEIQHAVGSSRR
jgi:hypothetical protein